MQAVFPGTFDPLTIGHLDILNRAARLFDNLTILIIRNSSKKFLFSIEERIKLVKQAIEQVHLTNITVDSYEGLTAQYCKEHNCKILIRGLRTGFDLDYEKPISIINRKINDELETLFLPSDPKYDFVSSTIIKEMARYNRDELKYLIPDPFIEPLKKKLAKN